MDDRHQLRRIAVYAGHNVLGPNWTAPCRGLDAFDCGAVAFRQGAQQLTKMPVNADQHPLVEFKDVRVQAVQDEAALLLVLHQPGLAQHPEVV